MYETLVAPILKPVFKYRDERHSSSSSNRYHLLLSIENQQFAFGLVENASGRCVWLERYDLTKAQSNQDLLLALQSIVGTHEILHSMFWQSVTINVQNQAFTLLPEALFRKEYASRYLWLAMGKVIEGDAETHHYLHENVRAVSVFAVYKPLVEWLMEAYPLQEIHFLHQSSVMIDFATRQSGRFVSLHGEKGAFTFTYSDHGRLVFCNRFSYKTPQDFAYYVLFVLKEMGLSALETPVHLSGLTEEIEEDLTALRKFVPNLTTTELSDKVIVPNEIPAANFLPLFESFML